MDMVVGCLFKQKTAYEMRISDWSSDVCSSDLVVWVAERDACVNCTALAGQVARPGQSVDGALAWGDKPLQWSGCNGRPPRHPNCRCRQIGRASCRERVCQYV